MNDILPLRARWLIIPLILSFVLIALYVYLYKQRKQAKYPISKGTAFWLLPVIAMYIATAVGIYADLFTCHRPVIAFFVATTFSVGIMVLMRDYVNAHLTLFLKRHAQKYNAHSTLTPDVERNKTTAGEKIDDSENVTKQNNAVTAAKSKRFSSWIAHVNPQFLSGAITCLLLLLISFLIFMSLEFAQYPKIFEKINLLFFIPNIALFLLFTTTLYFLAQRRGGCIVLGAFVFFGFGISCYYLLRFKNTVILPSDFFALSTAASVAGSFKYYLTDEALWSASYFMLVIGFCSWLRPHGVPKTKTSSKSFTVLTKFQNLPSLIKNTFYFAVGCLLIYVSCFVVTYRDFGIYNNYWDPKSYHQLQGTLVSFISECQDLKLPVPKNYSDENAQKLIAHYAGIYDKTLGSTQARRLATQQFNKQKPTIITVMNETYSDLSIYDGMHVGYKGPEFIKNGLSDAVQSGPLSVSILGGGTANSEFEYLTNQSCLFTGPGIAYSIYNLKNAPSLARNFKKLGYQTTAIHPFTAENWNRNVAYPNLGFDTFLSDKYFAPDVPRWRTWISDKATYQKVLDVLEQSDKPQFILDVTMANHASYSDKLVGDDYRPGYKPDFGDASLTDELNEYLGSIKKTDEEFQWFIEKVKQLKRPVVVIFFGDHQPSFPEYYNNAWYKNENEATHLGRLYQTGYVIWANYNITGAEQNNTQKHLAASNLSSHMLHAIGAPLTDYQKAQVAISQDLPVVSNYAIMSKDGSYYLPNDEKAPTASLQNDLAQMSYYHFARKL